MIFDIRWDVTDGIGLERMGRAETIPVFSRGERNEGESGRRKAASDEMFADAPPHKTVGTPEEHGVAAVLHYEDTGLMSVAVEWNISGDGRVIAEGRRWGQGRRWLG